MRGTAGAANVCCAHTNERAWCTHLQEARPRLVGLRIAQTVAMVALMLPPVARARPCQRKPPRAPCSGRPANPRNCLARALGVVRAPTRAPRRRAAAEEPLDVVRVLLQAWLAPSSQQYAAARGVSHCLQAGGSQRPRADRNRCAIVCAAVETRGVPGMQRTPKELTVKTARPMRHRACGRRASRMRPVCHSWRARSPQQTYQSLRYLTTISSVRRRCLYDGSSLGNRALVCKKITCMPVWRRSRHRRSWPGDDAEHGGGSVLCIMASAPGMEHPAAAQSPPAPAAPHRTRAPA